MERRTTIGEIESTAAKLYKRGSGLRRWMVRSRPRICPFHVLVDCVPRGSSLLDVGCGAGLLLNVLAYRSQISSGIGFDASFEAIEMARGASNEIGGERRATFLHLRRVEALPKSRIVAA